MTKLRNCPNCGAPYKTELNTCPYCSTSYFDMTAIDFEEQKPVYLKIKYHDMIITQLVIPSFGDIAFEQDYENIECGGRVIKRIWRGSTVTTNIHFHAIPNKRNELLTVQTKE